MRNVLIQAERAVTANGFRTLRRLLAVTLFATLTAVGAAMEVHLPGTPVPITMQTLFVSLSGALLGPWLGAASQSLYLLAGALGAPVFAGGAAGIAQLMGPTGGYLLAFPIAAAFTGRLAGPADTPRRVSGVLRLGMAILLGTFAIFAGGAAQLALLTGDAPRAIELGVVPFIVGDIIKVVGALLIALRLRARTLGSL